MEATLIAPTSEDTRDIGASLAGLLLPGDRIVLSGELGSGKTTFVQGVVRGLGAEVRAIEARLDDLERQLRLADHFSRHKLILLPDREAARRGLTGEQATPAAAG